ncbi:MAG: GNAT family N-acetyltransferase [Clostridia bacterium]|nr:GNAT family N-acetyltransferase [Clostridia bacterium]
MIHIEDLDFSVFALTKGMIAVPVEITLWRGASEPQITVYEQFSPLAEEFLKTFADDPFSGKAIGFWSDHLTIPMRSFGLEPSADTDNCIRIFKADAVTDIHTALIAENTCLINQNSELRRYENLTTHALQIDEDNPDDVCAVSLIEGKIVAYAALNDSFEDENTLEISVECAPAYRRQGLAASSAAALTYELIKRGYTVTYQCRRSNEASARVAEKVGFRDLGMRYSFVCYRNQ